MKVLRTVLVPGVGTVDIYSEVGREDHKVELCLDFPGSYAGRDRWYGFSDVLKECVDWASDADWDASDRFAIYLDEIEDRMVDELEAALLMRADTPEDEC